MTYQDLFRLLAPLFLGIFMLTFSGCLEDKCEAVQTFVEYQPVWVQPEELRTITLEKARPVAATGKIYTYLDLLFINEPYEGIHIFNNRNPENPEPLGFLSIPGNVDIAIRNDRLYADNGPDLITFSLANPANPQLINRQENVFDQYYQVQAEGILLYFEPTVNSVEISCDNPNWDEGWFMVDGIALRNEAAGLPNALPANQTGTGGSLARFTILDQWLYTVDQSDLRVFTLEQPDEPNEQATIHVGWGIETIFPYGDHLFLGANDGMYIFDATDRTAPSFLSVFRHARACDPVFVSGEVAYVTLRDGTECQNFINQLDVVDISDLSNPRLLQTFPMHHPIGLSVVGDWLYICEDDQGVKIFDREPLAEIGRGPVSRIDGFNAVDIIALPRQDLALIIGTDGLHQYDISDPEAPRFLSLIPVEETP